MPDPQISPQDDLYARRQAIHAGQCTPLQAAQASIEQALSPRTRAAFVELTPQALKDAAADPLNAQSPLAGLSVSVKDLFDVRGQITRAGSRVLADTPATADSPAVARLRRAGAGLIGRTHMVEFAFSGVGTNPHHETPANVCDALTPRIPGGSSSGAAVSVASGAAYIGLGSDTGGSIRIPAALNGIVGFKCTARLVPTEGTVPLSTTLDTVCALTRSVRDAVIAHEILAARQVVRLQKPLGECRFAIPETTMLDELTPPVARAFEQTIARIRQAGARVEPLRLDELKDLPGIQTSGGFSAAESYHWHRKLLALHRTAYDPRVAARIARGADMKAWEYLDLCRDRLQWIGRMEQAITGFDALLSPTVPLTAPPIADVAPGDARDAEFFRVNALLLRNTSVVNMLDGCAISIPCQNPGDMPVGLMIWQGALHDDAVLHAALQIEHLLQTRQ